MKTLITLSRDSRKLVRRIIISSTIALGMSGAAFAAGPPGKVKTEMRQLFSNENHFYAGAGVKAYFFDLPKVSPSWSTTDTSNKPVASNRFNRTAVGGNLILGYQFTNDDFFTSVFGNENDIELDSLYLNSTTNERNPRSSVGSTIWGIDGRGKITQTNPHMPFGAVKISNQIKDYDFNLRWVGHKQLSNWLSMSPSIGLVYTQLDNDVKSKLEYFTTGPRYDVENFDTIVDYYGLSLGDRLTFHFSDPRIEPYISAQIQLLAARADLSAYQDWAYPTSGTATVKVNDHQSTALTYRAKAEVGMNLHFTKNLLSPYINIAAGLDDWAWTPKVVAPHGAGDKKVHLDMVNTLNPYVGLNVVFPLA